MNELNVTLHWLMSPARLMATLFYYSVTKLPTASNNWFESTAQIVSRTASFMANWTIIFIDITSFWRKISFKVNVPVNAMAPRKLTTRTLVWCKTKQWKKLWRRKNKCHIFINFLFPFRQKWVSMENGLVVANAFSIITINEIATTLEGIYYRK